MGQYSEVGIATRYGLHVPEIESRWRARLSAPVQTVPRAHSASYRMNTGSLPGVKRPGRGVDCPPHLAPRLKKWYSHTSTLPLWAFTACSWVNQVTQTLILLDVLQGCGTCLLRPQKKHSV